MSAAAQNTPISPPAINQTLRALHVERLARHPPAEVGRYQLMITEQPGLALGAHTWISSLVLSKYMQESLVGELRGKKVVELGAGTGVVGITAALLGADVVLTDQFDVLSLLRANTVSNCKGCNCSVREYQWGAAVESLAGPFDFIVAADVVYRPDLFTSLISSFELLASPDTVIYLGFKERSTRDREFFQLLAENFDYVMATRTNHTEDDVVVFRIQKKRRSYLFRSLGNNSPAGE